jgi:hypothetical protein
MTNLNLGWFFWGVLAAIQAEAQQTAPVARVDPQVLAKAVTDGRVTVVYLAPRYATAIRMHEAVNSVVVGDPASFSAEHSEQEPNLVFVKPITTKPAQTNLLISTSRGHQASLLLISRGELHGEQPPVVDFVLRYKPAGRFLIEPADYPAALVAETANIEEGGIQPALVAKTAGTANVGMDPMTRPADSARTTLDELLDRQRKAHLPELYGGKPGISDPGKELVKAGVSEVIDQGREVVVLFSVVNPQQHAIELMPPQIQLCGKLRSGKVIKHSRWGTAEQYPIADYRLSRRRIGAGERSDGVVVFDRPPYKQSNETLFLQVAESGAVDRPALAPIGFGISNFDLRQEGGSYGKPSGQ